MRTCGWLAILSLSTVLQEARAPAGQAPASAPAVPRDRAAAPARVVTAGPRILLEAGQHSPKDLVAMSCTVLKRNELVNWAENPQHEMDRITLTNPMEVDRKDFERVVSSLMYSRKYVLTPLDPANGLWEWIFLMGPNKGQVRQRAVPMSVDQLRDYQGPIRFVTTYYTLKKLDPQKAVNSLRPQYGQDQSLGMDPITPVGGSRGVVITHFADTAANIIRILDLADQNAMPPEEAAAQDQVRILSERVQALEKSLQAMERRLLATPAGGGR